MKIFGLGTDIVNIKRLEKILKKNKKTFVSRVFSKNEISCDLKGEHSSAFVNGIFSLNKNKHHEIKAKINHLVEKENKKKLK